MHLIILAAELHERLATIQPFIDGNGRSSRLVMNIILLQSGFPIVIIHGDMDTRLAVLYSIQKCNIEDGKTDSDQFIVQTLIASRDVYWL